MDNRRDFLQRAAALGLGLAAPRAFAQPKAGEAQPLRMGVHPYNSTLALVAMHQPLVRYLEKAIGRPVEFYTAADFDSYVASLVGGDYDLAICPPHFAVLASNRGMAPLVHYQLRLEPILLVRADGKLRTLKDLRGKRIAMADRTALIRIAVVKQLEENGLVAGRDYEIVEKPSHGASVAAAAVGEVDAGVITITILKQLPEDVQQQLRIIGTGISFPNLVTMAKRSFGTAELFRIRDALLAFQATAEGKEFFFKSGFGGYEEVKVAEFDSLKPYVDAYLRIKGGADK
ncbi:MAG: phosphate/phosphite/phosphonate ABC transporter substrate-binding protein [Sterolibacteriaceae bacterium MAG5]|nr:phosphate/phosphite/phosphonate ABC transporter substrate-binding protein [Candidatus Nitricoxidireducens bremensis]